MTRFGGQCRLIGIDIGEIAVDFFGPNVIPGEGRLAAKFAFISEDSSRMGSGNRNSNWSPETLEKLRELVAHMESDICSDLADAGASTDSGGSTDLYHPDGVPGL